MRHVDMKFTISKQVQEFIRESFQGNPDYSFGDWTIMYKHSLKVKETALQIAKSVECDKELLAIEALLHDIGKVYRANSKMLRKHHAKLGYKVAGKFVEQLDLSRQMKKELMTFLKGRKGSIEGQIVKDADVVSFFSDVKLQKAFKNWAEKEGLRAELQRKANKINELEFDVSKKIAWPFYEKMKRRWCLK